MAAANEISVGAAVAAVLPDLDDIFTLKGEQRLALKVFEVEKMFSLKSRLALVRDEINSVVHCSSPRGSDARRVSPLEALSCCYAAKLAVKKKSDRTALNVTDRGLIQSASKFCLPFSNAFCGIFTTWIHEETSHVLCRVMSVYARV